MKLFFRKYGLLTISLLVLVLVAAYSVADFTTQLNHTVSYSLRAESASRTYGEGEDWYWGVAARVNPVKIQYGVGYKLIINKSGALVTVADNYPNAGYTVTPSVALSAPFGWAASGTVTTLTLTHSTVTITTTIGTSSSSTSTTATSTTTTSVVGGVSGGGLPVGAAVTPPTPVDTSDTSTSTSSSNQGLWVDIKTVTKSVHDWIVALGSNSSTRLLLGVLVVLGLLLLFASGSGKKGRRR